jgi:hypothetical protein
MSSHGEGASRRCRRGRLVAGWVALAACTNLESAQDRFEFSSGGTASTGAGTSSSGSPAASGNDIGGSAGKGVEGPSSSGTNASGNGAAANEGGSDGQGHSGNAGTAGGTGGDGCPPIEERRELRLGAAGQDFAIDGDTTWTCDVLYVLAGRVIVGPTARLTIEPGTLIRAEPSSLLLVQRGGELDARGSAALPIVFTSAKPIGMREPGDWRGLILIGNARTHATNRPVYDATDDLRSFYGGGPEADPATSCGALRYVRVEFAGGNLEEEGTPGAALTLAGCGERTQVDHVQVHRATDGIGLIGGSAALTHVLVSANEVGDCIEWTEGYAGRMQFVIAQSLGAGAALSGGNSAADPDREPRSAPVIYNATLVGSAPLFTPSGHLGALLRFGSHVTLKNSLVVGFAHAAFDLRGVPVEVGPGEAIDISHVLMFGNHVNYTPGAEALMNAESMRVDDPGLSFATDRAAPNFRPSDAAVGIDAAPVPRPFDTTAAYRGAIAHQGLDWTQGFCEYPAD